MLDRSSNLLDNVTPTSSPTLPIGPRPAFPAQAPAVQHLGHDLPHIPTARTAAGSYTRAQLDRAIAKAAQDEPRVPAFDDAWGRPSAWAAFGDGAA